MGLDISFIGEIFFENNQDMEEALSEIHESIEFEDKFIKETWAESYMKTTNSIKVDLDVGCTYDDFFAYECIIEILTDYGSKGKIKGRTDEYDEGEYDIYEAENQVEN